MVCLAERLCQYRCMYICIAVPKIYPLCPSVLLVVPIYGKPKAHLPHEFSSWLNLTLVDFWI